MKYSKIVLGSTAILLSSSVLAMAQMEQAPQPGAEVTPAEQSTENPMVPADDADYSVYLTGAEGQAQMPPVTTAAGWAWLAIDEEAGTLSWTIEYSGAEALGARLACSDNQLESDVALETEDGGHESPIEGQVEISGQMIESMREGDCRIELQVTTGFEGPNQESYIIGAVNTPEEV